MEFAGPLVGLLGSFAPEVRYTLCPKRHAERLRNRMGELNRKKEATRQVVLEKTTQQPWSQMNPHVEDWIKSVEALSGRVDELDLEGDLPFWLRLCCCYTYALKGKIQQCLEEIDRLGNERPDANKGDLVIDVIPIADLKEKLENEIEKLRATKTDLEYKVSWLETSVAFPPRVRSERVKLWIRGFHSLETEVSKVSGSIGSAAAATSTSTTNPNEVTVAASTSATDSDEAAAALATSAIDPSESERKRNIRKMMRRIADHSDQLKKLKEEDGLVVETLPGVEALQNVLQDLRLKKKELESRVLDLERTAVNPCKVRSQSVRSWLGKFDSLEEKVSKLVDSIKAQAAAATLANGPNATAEAVAGTSSATTSHAAATEANTSNAAAEVAATHSQQNSEIQTMSTTVTELFEQLKKLKEEEDELVVEAPPQHIHELPGQSAEFVVGIEEKLEELEKLLDDEETKVILIHGMGGSGKTTLVRELTQKLKLPSRGGKDFDFVFSVVVSQNLDIHQIQEDVFVQLGYRRDDTSLPKSIDDRASFIKKKLNDVSFLLVLDDVWEPLHDLSMLGFQYSSSKKCKVVVTSRKADVCERRESLQIIEIGLLQTKHARQLFCRVCKSGLIESDELVKSLAWKIVDKCGGLPLLLKTVASAMVKNRNYHDWFSAKNQLNNYPDAIKGMAQVYGVLKFSFDRLENDGLRVCLLYCALFNEDYSIEVDELIPYLIVECFVGESYDFDTLWHKARHDIIEKLKESSLLETGKNLRNEDDDDYVKLHDAVREMLLSLGNDWKVISCAEEGRDGLINVDSWDGVRMASVWGTGLIEKFASGEVTLSSLGTLRVRTRSDLPTSLFPQFSSLRILDLSRNRDLSEIPKSIGSLKSLLYLNLSYTRITELPVEIGNLTNLHTLDLSWTTRLYEIPRDAISPLEMLQSLNLWRCRCFKDEKEGMLKVVDVSRGLPKLKDVGLELYGSIDDDVVESMFPLTSQLCLEDMDNVTSSKISKLQRLKYLSLSCVRSTNIILKSPCWRLQELLLFRCHDFEHLGWIRHLPSLTRLEVKWCDNLQELVPKDMSEENRDESSCRYDDPTILLSKLRVMSLLRLPKLESISSVNLPFPCLTRMGVFGCPRIRSLPIKSSNSVRTKIGCQKEWWESLKWEDDECSSSRFIPNLY